MTPLRPSVPLLLLCASLLLPGGLGHEPRGFPKTYCEPHAEWYVHEYLPPVGTLAAPPFDGNLDDCDADGDALDFDGHSEAAVGLAVFLAVDGDGLTTGSLACYGEPAHHPHFGTFSIHDAVAPSGVAFTVTADTDPGCGDFLIDESQVCVDACSVRFDPGSDGAYVVFGGASVLPVGAVAPQWGHLTLL